MERAAIDVQIATAKKYPRVLSVVKAKMLSFATLDEETAAGCFFTLPGRKGGDGKAIQGPSIRMAEIAISCFQNLRAGARVIADDGKVITSQGVCHDLENNVCISVEVKRRVTNKEGKRYSDDMVVMTGNAACSIALRNATFRVVPLALVKPIYEAAKKVAIGDAKTLVDRRAGALAHFTKMGVDKARVFGVLGVKALEDIGLEHLEILIGLANAIKEGDTTVDEAFPVDAKPAPDAPKFQKPAATVDEIPGAEVPPVVQEPVKVARKPRVTPLVEPSLAAAGLVSTTLSPKVQLASILDSRGVKFDDLCYWLGTSERDTNAASYSTVQDVPEAVAAGLVANDAADMQKFLAAYATKP